MSHKWHGSQENNKHSVIIADTYICSPTLGLWFDTDAARATLSMIKDKKDRESGQFDAISVILHGKERKMRQLYMTEDEEGTNVIASKFWIGLRKAEASVVVEMKSKRQKITHDVSSDTSLVAASNMTAVSSPFGTEGSTRLPPKKQILQRMLFSEMSVGTRIEKSILYEGTVVHVDKSSVNASSCSLTVDWDNGTTSCVEYPDEDICIIGRLGTFLYDFLPLSSCSSPHLSPFISSSCCLLLSFLR